jgi:uncharacterized glyoxalase superfamily protein PhnB
MAVKPIPDGYHHVTPYLIVRGADALVEFLKQSFGAKEMMRHARPDGAVMHAEVRIGDSVVMLADASDQHPPAPCVLHLYTEDTDAAYQRALKAGGTSLREPATQFYGDRSAGVKDPFGNSWWISTHVEDVSPEEIERRAAAQGGH